MNLIGEIFTDKIIFSLGWTFINSLWQAGFICIINWMILFMLSRQNARFRYIVSTISLFTILFFSLSTFLILSNYYDSSSLAAGSLTVNEVKNSTQSGFYDMFFLKFIPFSSSEYLDYFNSNLPLILTVWFWSVLFLSLKQLGGFALTQRLGHYRTILPEVSWQKKVEQMTDQLGISKPVKLLESAIVKVPTVIGFFKPVILIPMGLLLAIPPNQLETILLHELAHIKRRDFLINILQNILEVIFFFNPFVWLISSIVRSEREHCCDDLVVNVSGDSILYIKALANISTLDPVKSNYAMAISLNQNQLLKRIDRIIKMKNYKNSYSRVFISSLFLLTGIAFLSANAMGGYSSKYEKSVTFDQQPIVQEELKAGIPKSKPEPQDKKENQEKMNKKKLITELKKKLETATDDETKRKLEHEIQSLIEGNDDASADKYEDLAKKEKMINELRKKLETVTDEETKRKLEHKLQSLIEKDKEPSSAMEESMRKKEQMIQELKKKYEATTDEELKSKIEAKIKSIKKDNYENQKYSAEEIKLQKEKMIQELKKKYAETTDEETKKKIEAKIKAIKEK